jgi:hypothetical protein
MYRRIGAPPAPYVFEPRLYRRIDGLRQCGIGISARRMDLPCGKTYSSLIELTRVVMTAPGSLSGPSRPRLPYSPLDPFAFAHLFKVSSCPPFCTTVYSTSILSSIAASLFTKERNTMLNTERDSPSDPLPDSHPYHASLEQDPWASMLATIHRLSAPPDPMPHAPDLPERPRSSARPFRARMTDADNVPTYTVTVVEELSNSLFSLCWHDPTRCNYGEQIWALCVARVSGCCALSGKRIVRGDRVYRPRIRGRTKPLNGDAMILAGELLKDRETACAQEV